MKKLRELIQEVVEKFEGPEVEIRDLTVSYDKVTIIEEHEEIEVGVDQARPAKKPGKKKKAEKKQKGPKKGHKGRKKGSKNKPKTSDDNQGQPLLQ